jgi:hypothetical protein
MKASKVLNVKKASTNRVLIILTILVAFIFFFSFYQVLNWNLFPWLNLTILFGLSFSSLIFLLMVKIQSRIIIALILSILGLQFVVSLFFLSQPKILGLNWQWLLFPSLLIFSCIFWDLFSRKLRLINFIGRVACLTLLLLSVLKFSYLVSWIDYLLIGLIFLIMTILIFSKNNAHFAE